jgi:hypothetical protein
MPSSVLDRPGRCRRGIVYVADLEPISVNQIRAVPVVTGQGGNSGQVSQNVMRRRLGCWYIHYSSR